MPRSNVILNLPGFSIVKVSGIDRVIFELKYIWVLRCSHCKRKRVRKKSSYMREQGKRMSAQKTPFSTFCA